MGSVKLKRPIDAHVHVRRGRMMELVLPFTSDVCAAALVMPNTGPPILTPDDIRSYRGEILSITQHKGSFVPLMTFKLRQGMEPDEVSPLKEAGAIAGKYYPVGVTTNSADGVSNIYKMERVFAEMERHGVVLCLHAEDPEADAVEREKVFLHKHLGYLVSSFPKLKIVVEHISTEYALDMIMSASENVAATVTLHHLLLTLEDIIGGPLDPHSFCRPIAKSVKDRNALVQAVFAGSEKLMLGSDSAPHAVEKKECSAGAAGIFTAPVLIPLLYQMFSTDLTEPEQAFNAFTFDNTKKFYELDWLLGGFIELAQETWTVPEKYVSTQTKFQSDAEDPSYGVLKERNVFEVKPFWAGKGLHWKVRP